MRCSTTSTYNCEECARQFNIGANYYVYDLQSKNVAIYKSEFSCLNVHQQYAFDSRVNLEKWMIYGAAGRIGSQLPPKISANSRDLFYSQAPPSSQTPNIGCRLLDNKEYEITDHLGNLRVLLSDVKIPSDISSGRLSANYTADVLYAANYYPYGKEIPEQTWTADNELPYLFGYNGMLKDNHIAGEGKAYYTLFREYDPIPGRWWSADPLRAKYPSMSPYLAFGANPIIFIDKIGLVYEPPINYVELKSQIGDEGVEAFQTSLSYTLAAGAGVATIYFTWPFIGEYATWGAIGGGIEYTRQATINLTLNQHGDNEHDVYYNALWGDIEKTDVVISASTGTILGIGIGYSGSASTFTKAIFSGFVALVEETMQMSSGSQTDASYSPISWNGIATFITGFICPYIESTFISKFFNPEHEKHLITKANRVEKLANERAPRSVHGRPQQQINAKVARANATDYKKTIQQVAQLITLPFQPLISVGIAIYNSYSNKTSGKKK